MKKEKLLEPELTKDFLQECFDYTEDGALVWKERPISHFNSEGNWKRFNTPNVGKVAGYFNKRTDSKRKGFGYWRTAISYQGRLGHFKLHRLIWLYQHGWLPEVVDHEDTNTRNNRLSNLREATFQKNSCNENIPVNNTSGYKGVSKSNAPVRRARPYRVTVEVNGYSFSSGNYKSAEYAATVYNYIAKRLHGDFALLNDVGMTDDNVILKGKVLVEDLPQILDGTFDWNSKTKRLKRRGLKT